MTIQRDINPENDKKLDEMLEAKFGSRSKTLVKGSTARILNTLLKRAVAARKQFEDSIFDPRRDAEVSKEVQEPADHGTLPGRDKTNPAYKRGVSKHGTHDQRTHGRGRTGGNAEERYTSRFRPQPGNKYRLSEGSGVGSGQTVRTVSRDRIKTDGRGIPTNVEGAYKPVDWKREVAVQFEDGSYSTYPKGNLRPVKDDDKKVTKRSIRKHPGHPDQRVHSPKGRAAIAGEQGKRPRPTSPTSEWERGRLGRAVWGGIKGMLVGGAITLAVGTGALVAAAAGAGGLALGAGVATWVLGGTASATGGILGAIGGYRREQSERRKKLTKKENTDVDVRGESIDAGDHVLVVSKNKTGFIGVYVGNNIVRTVIGNKMVDVRTTTQNRRLVAQGNTIPDPKNEKELVAMVKELAKEKTQVEQMSQQNSPKQKVQKRRTQKHLQGEHDQADHAPKSRAPAKVRVRAAGRAVREAGEMISPRATRAAEGKLRQLGRKLNPKKLIPQIDSVLDDIDASSRIAQRLREIRDDLADLFRATFPPKQEKVTKAMLNAQLEKGIAHSLEVLTNAIRLIGEQEADHEISAADDKKLGELIGNINGMVGYLKDVKEQGFFEKAVEKHGTHDQKDHAPGVSRRANIGRPYKNNATWELKNMRRALSSMPLLNTEDDDRRLKAVEDELKERGKSQKVSKRQVRKHPGDHDQQVHDPTRGRGARGKPSKERLELDPETGGTVLIPKPSLTMSSPEEANSVMHHVKTGVNKPYVSAYVSTLGGKERPSVMLTISLDPKETWTNGILENSRYAKFDIDHTGRIKQISGPLKFRSAKPKNVEQLVSMLNTKLREKVSKGEPHVPDSGTMYRPSYTTPAVRRELERQGIKPNAKGRGISTARAPGY